MKVIDSDTNVAEMYGELRKEGKRCTALHASKTDPRPELEKGEPRKGKHRTRRKNKNRK